MRRLDGPFPIWEIVPGVLYQRGKLHGMAPEKKMAGLQHYGVTHVVALAPPTPDPDLAAWGELLLYYRHRPMPDGRLRAHGEALVELADELVHELNHGGTLLTMCNAGRNRSGLLSALVLRSLYGLSGEAALTIVRANRPLAVANPEFESFLRTLP
jgi:hypothetical protein